ncbi:MAG: hypothetical protein U1C59_03475, partial [Methylotenera sp.]|nr:hypothetical protein [Methylotenera sp.]
MYNITQEAGAAIAWTTGGTGTGQLHIKGNISIAGTFAFTLANGGGGIFFNGDATQTISGAGSGTTTITGATTINSGSTLATSRALTISTGLTINGSFQINQGGWASGAGDFVYGVAGTLVFNNSSGFYGVPGDAKYWPVASGPVNVTVQNTGGLQLETSRTVTGLFQTSTGVRQSAPGNDLTVSGTVRLNSGAFFENFSPMYSGSATLVYNTAGTYGVSNEWGAGTSVGYGVPQNVTIQNSTTVTTPTTNRTAPGNITISSGGLTLNGTSGDLSVGGNWSNSGTFTPNNRAVFFNGTGDQSIGATTFDWLLINKASGAASLGGSVTV